MAETDSYWLPFTPNRAFKQAPRLFVRAEGMYLWNDRGERLLDGCSGLWNINIGHGRPIDIDRISRHERTVNPRRRRRNCFGKDRVARWSHNQDKETVRRGWVANGVERVENE